MIEYKFFLDESFNIIAMRIGIIGSALLIVFINPDILVNFAKTSLHSIIIGELVLQRVDCEFDL